MQFSTDRGHVTKGHSSECASTTAFTKVWDERVYCSQVPINECNALPLWEIRVLESCLQEWEASSICNQSKQIDSTQFHRTRKRPTLCSSCRVVGETHGWSLWRSTKNRSQWRRTQVLHCLWSRTPHTSTSTCSL